MQRFRSFANNPMMMYYLLYRITHRSQLTVYIYALLHRLPRIQSDVKKIFYPTLTWKTAAFATCWALRKWGNARLCSKNRKKNLTLSPVIVWKSKKPSTFTGRLWNAVIRSRHKMEMKYSDEGRLVQRQPYPLPSRSLQYWPMNHCVRNITSRRSVFEKLRNTEVIFLITVSLKSGIENSIILELNAEADRIILLFFLSVVICFLIFTSHASFRDKICSWNILSSLRDSPGVPVPGPSRLPPPLLPPPSCPPPACQQ